jgi:hypothetical protein
VIKKYDAPERRRTGSYYSAAAADGPVHSSGSSSSLRFGKKSAQPSVTTEKTARTAGDSGNAAGALVEYGYHRGSGGGAEEADKEAHGVNPGAQSRMTVAPMASRLMMTRGGSPDPRSPTEAFLGTGYGKPGLTLCRVGGELIFDNRYNHSGVRLTVTSDCFAAA